MRLFGNGAARALAVTGTVVAAVALTACGSSRKSAGPCTGWTQWGQNATHGGNACAYVQPLKKVLAQVTFDPFVAQEQAENGGDLVDHFPSPLLVDDSVYMLSLSGTYVPCDPPGSGQLADGGTDCGNATRDQEIWNEKDFQWENGKLTEKWTFASDWKPTPSSFDPWEAMFQAVVVGSDIYVPGANGTVYKLDRATGKKLARIDPFSGVSLAANQEIFVAGGLVAAPDGSVYYDALELDDITDPWDADATGWLVKISPDDTAKMATFDSLAVGAPKPTDQCTYVFSSYYGDTLPYPPAPVNGQQVYPATIPCNHQRPSLNVVPAIAPDGTVYTVSRSHWDARYSYLLAVNPDLTPKWASSMRGLLDDGCGITVPADSPADGSAPNNHCRVGATPGVDPLTNQKPAAWADDDSSSSPVVLPDGKIIYGALTTYNTSRGHLLEFDPNGKFLRSFGFGWDVTPAYDEHDGTYSILIKDNHYFHWDGSAPEFDITRLGTDLTLQWSFASTNTKTCVRKPDGSVSCSDDGQHPNGFEWCINAPAVDPDGNVLVNSEDGHLYEIDRSGKQVGSVMLKQALGAAYTPLAVDNQGRVYSLNGGDMFVVGE